jgi:hypothetical protein
MPRLCPLKTVECLVVESNDNLGWETCDHNYSPHPSPQSCHYQYYYHYLTDSLGP